MRISYNKLKALEPRLQEAEDLARLHAGKNSDHIWYHIIKPRFKNLVGFMSRHDNPLLRTTNAYSAVYRRLLNIYESNPPDEGSSSNAA